jgi:DNA-binding NarL/FixJ family response regulator
MIEEQVVDVFVVEDSKLVSFAIKTSLDRVKDFRVVGSAYDGESALTIIRECAPNVILVDIGLPNMNGIELTRHIKEETPRAKVIVLTASDTIEDILGALDAGADGYVLKEVFGERLEMAIRSVRTGAVWLDPHIAKALLNQALVAGAKTTRRTSRDELTQEDVTRLGALAESDCDADYCLVDPEFVRKVHNRLASQPAETGT